MAAIREDEMGMKEERNAYSIIGRGLQKVPVGRPICRWEFSMKTKLEVTHCFASVCILVSQNKVQWRHFVRTKKEPSVSTECSLLDHLNDFQSCKTLKVVHVVLSEVCHDEHDV